MDFANMHAREAATSLPTNANTFGAILVGWGLSSIVFGMFCLQVWTYFNKYPNDSWGNKTLVLVIWACEVAHQGLIGHAAWHYLIDDNGKGELVFLEKTLWSLSTVVLLGAFVGMVVKVCFGMRAYKLSKGNYFAAVLICSMAIAQFGIATAYSVQTLSHLMIQLVDLKTIGSLSLAVGAATDVVTALVLCYYLHTMRTGYRRSDTLINRLIAFSVNTGGITSACSLSVLVAYQLMPTNFIFIALYFLLCKLYSNSCMATLNSRRFVGGRGTDRDESQSNGNSAYALHPRSRNTTINEFKSADVSKMSHNLNHINIGVRQEVSILRDDDTKVVPTIEYDYHRGEHKSEGLGTAY